MPRGDVLRGQNRLHPQHRGSDQDSLRLILHAQATRVAELQKSRVCYCASDAHQLLEEERVALAVRQILRPVLQTATAVVVSLHQVVVDPAAEHLLGRHEQHAVHFLIILQQQHQLRPVLDRDILQDTSAHYTPHDVKCTRVIAASHEQIRGHFSQLYKPEAVLGGSQHCHQVFSPLLVCQGCFSICGGDVSQQCAVVDCSWGRRVDQTTQ
mmetsp:Transcript_34981/g.65294  ORF Transcript_34981/g.65294 Transcript_34981/m.65294 type:complete len:211 (-) Transcript_34981:249-881(-)